MLFTMKTSLALVIGMVPFLVVQSPIAVERVQAAVAVLEEDYSLYDRVIGDKFLTSQIQLVVLERMTVSRLMPQQDGSMTMDVFQQHGYFYGLLRRILFEILSEPTKPLFVWKIDFSSVFVTDLCPRGRPKIQTLVLRPLL
jgi:hypothetical protein